MSRMTGRRVGAAVAAFSVACAGAVAVLGPSDAEASSHREVPLIAADPAVDNTDVYAFVSPERPGYVTFIANFIPFEEPNGGPNFYPFATDATYNVRVDSNGDAARRRVPAGRSTSTSGAATRFLQQLAGHFARLPQPAVPPDLRAGGVVRRRPVPDPRE